MAQERRPIVKPTRAQRRALADDVAYYVTHGRARPLSPAEQEAKARAYAERCALYHATEGI